MKTYTETQQFRQWWIWTLLLAVTVTTVTAIVLTTSEFDLVTLVSLTGSVLALLSFFVMRLDTRIDQVGIRYRFFPLGWRSIPWSRIEKADVYPSQFVGYGVRWNGDGWYYNINGQWGLNIDRVSGKRLVIGTQRPDELREFLRSFHPQNQE